MLSNFTTASTGQIFTAYLLKEKDIPAFLELHATQEGVKPRSYQDLKAHLDAGMPIIGVKLTGSNQHIAHLLLTDLNSEVAVNTYGYPNAQNTAVIQSVVVNPNYRTQKLSEIFSEATVGQIEKMAKPHHLLFQQAQQIAMEMGFEKLMAKINVANKKSLGLFTKQGFEISDTFKIKSESYAAHYVSAPVMGASIDPSINTLLDKAPHYEEKATISLSPLVAIA